MNITLLFIILFVGAASAGFIAVIQHRKRIEKISEIESKCEDIIVLADAISNTAPPITAVASDAHHVALRKRDVVRQYAQLYSRTELLLNSEDVLKAVYLKIDLSERTSMPKQSVCYPGFTCKTPVKREVSRAYQRNYLAYG